MTQMIYAIPALGIVAIVAVSMQRSSGSNEQNVYTNEVLTQLVTIGRDVVDDIGRQNLPFDAKVDPNRLPLSSTYPYVHGASKRGALDVQKGRLTDRNLQDLPFTAGWDCIWLIGRPQVTI